MSITFQYSTYLLATLVAGSVLLGGCKKDKVPNVEPVELTKWEKIVGNYKVFDTLGIYLYDMSITHSDTLLSNGFHYDSLCFMNFDGKFNFSSLQGFGTNFPETYIGLSPINPTKDVFGKSWHLYGISDVNFKYNTLRNDTIRLKFRTNNILYYIQDAVPYIDDTLWQIAVKQH